MDPVEQLLTVMRLLHSYIRKRKKGYLAMLPLKWPTRAAVSDASDMSQLFPQCFVSVFVDAEPEPFGETDYQLFQGAMDDLSIFIGKILSVLSGLSSFLRVGVMRFILTFRVLVLPH